MKLEYEIVYSKRKTLNITVERDRSVIVRAPENTPLKKIEEILERKKQWLYEKINHPQKYPENSRRKEFVNGEGFLYLGNYYALELVPKQADPVLLNDFFCVRKASRKIVEQTIRKWFEVKAQRLIPERVRFYATRLGVRYTSINVVDTKYRWGSCTTNRALNFNWRLIKAPMEVIDYVVVHELAHLIEDNHSPAFWNIVSVQLPEYETSKKWLREYGGELEVEL